MHRDGPNMEFDPIERNTRRLVWWSIYTFEKILCGILGRPTVVDDSEMSMKLPDAPMLEQKSMSAEFMGLALELHQLSYRLRQRAYFDVRTAEERPPTLAVATTLLQECDGYLLRIPRHMSFEAYTTVPSDRLARLSHPKSRAQYCLLGEQTTFNVRELGCHTRPKRRLC
jgi:proline utilization trans-activator